ncbi:MAG TPA: hypothetical protein VFX45_08915 [Solirubrobacterales bacterium]|nr:hypothetical protein [Solirubrobacterales bacterium]
MSEPLKADRLTPRERRGAAGVGVVVWVLAGLLLFFPPEVKEAGGEGCSSSGHECGVVEVSADTETVSVVLVGLGGVALAVALLGIRFTKLSAGGVAVEGTVAEVSAKSGRLKKGVKSWEDSASLFAQLPEWAQSALNEWAEEGSVLTRQARHSVEDVQQESSRAWLVWVRLDNEEVRALRLTYGRGSSRVADQPG